MNSKLNIPIYIIFKLYKKNSVRMYFQKYISRTLLSKLCHRKTIRADRPLRKRSVRQSLEGYFDINYISVISK